MGADRVAVIVCCGDRQVTADLLRQLSSALITAHRFVELETHAGIGWHGRYDYWYHHDWLMSETPPVEQTAAEFRPCPRCGGSGTLPLGSACPVCDGKPWRATWDFGVGYPAEWVRQAVLGGGIAAWPNCVLAPDGRLHPYWWFERGLSEYPDCWVVPMVGGP